MMSEGKQEIFEKAKSVLIKLGTYSDDKEKGDKSKISSTELEHLLESALIGMHSTFRETDISSSSIPDKSIRILCRKNKSYLSYHANFEDINEIRNRISEIFPIFEQSGIIDKNELTFKMMEEVYEDKTEENYRHSQEAYSKGIRSLQLMSAKQDPFLNGVWRQHASEYVIVKSILDELGIDVKEDDVKKLWEERKFELYKRNSPDSISTGER